MSYGEIQSQNPTDSGKIWLSYPEFDFYAQSLVENKGLKIDTAICAEQIRTQDNIITNIDEQLTNSQDIITNQGIMIDMKNKDFANLAVDFTKQKKKTKRFQQTTLTFIATTLVLIILVLFK